MGYSSIAQAGYLVAALAVGAVGALLAYLAAYAVSTLTVFAVIAARESERPDLGDDVSALDGLAKERPLLAWLGTLGLFGLAGMPLTAGFFGKIAVAGALVNADKSWLAVLVLVGSIISLGYYAPPVIRMWRTVGGGVPAPKAPTSRPRRASRCRPLRRPALGGRRDRHHRCSARPRWWHLPGSADEPRDRRLVGALRHQLARGAVPRSTGHRNIEDVFGVWLVLSGVAAAGRHRALNAARSPEKRAIRVATEVRSG